MEIKVLPSLLVNQIAAGEVIERPASVVKELVENSLDSGAKNIVIDIKAGGSQLIKVRDDGVGIPKNELILAITPHATSKLSTFEDLNNILTLGFRGEALASISSISKFSITSKTLQQAEAWRIQIDGRNTTPNLLPAAHPNGTTIEVVELFFNTPARKRFLYSEKTEFIHIVEIINRISLAKPAINFTLNHNDKKILQYQSKNQNDLFNKRLSDVYNKTFLEDIIYIKNSFENMYLSGWLKYDNLSKKSIHYTYINSRFVRDKIVTHAVKQAINELYPNNDNSSVQFIIFLEIDPKEIDVNVHPAKSEVRFHQSRIVHDFIYYSIINATEIETIIHNHDLSAENPSLAIKNDISVQKPAAYNTSYLKKNRSVAGDNIFIAETFYKNNISPQHIKANTNLLNDVATAKIDYAATPILENHIKVLTVIDNIILLEFLNSLFILSSELLQQLWSYLQIITEPASPLLIPVLIDLDSKIIKNETFENKLQLLQKWHINSEVVKFNVSKLKINALPSILKSQNIQQIITSLLNADNISSSDLLLKKICLDLQYSKSLEKADVITMLAYIENKDIELLKQSLVKIDLTKFLPK